MGASWFETQPTPGDTVQEAFRTAVEDAQYLYGHGGYTGTIAEKSSFKVVNLAPGESVQDCLDRHSDSDEFEKWGPCGALKTAEGWVFFGWASE